MRDADNWSVFLDALSPLVDLSILCDLSLDSDLFTDFEAFVDAYMDYFPELDKLRSDRFMS